MLTSAIRWHLTPADPPTLPKFSDGFNIGGKDACPLEKEVGGRIPAPGDCLEAELELKITK